MPVKAVLLQGGVVVNSARFESLDDIFPGWQEAPNNVGPGWVESGGEFTPPAQPPVDVDNSPSDGELISALIDIIDGNPSIVVPDKARDVLSRRRR